MKGFKFLIVALATLFSASPALAAQYRLSAAGRVDAIVALQDSGVVATPSGVVSIGDVFSLEATFDLEGLAPQALYDADPTLNIYYLPNVVVTARIGSYVSTFTPKFDFNAGLQLWNDHDVVGPVDAQTFDFFNYLFTPTVGYPFDLGARGVSESVGLSAFDFTATARNSDLVTEIAPFSAFGSKSLTYGILNADTNLFVYVGASNVSATLSAVPEPRIWAMMVLGFLLAALALRARPRTPVLIAN